MAAPEKYPEESPERASRMAVEVGRAPATKAGALARVARRLGLNPQALGNRVRQAEKARSYRYGHPGTVL